MNTFVVVHGAWSAGWAWWRMHPLFLAARHRLLTPTCTGLGERSHLLGPCIDLHMHVDDVVRVIESENLNHVILVGHSYGGMVVTGVADRIPDRIKQLIYIDALLPESAECALDLMPQAQQAAIREDVKNRGFDWLIPPSPLPPDTPDHDQSLALGRRGPQPLATFTSPVYLAGRASNIPSAYIYCTKTGLYDTFGLSASRAQAREGWQYHELPASHNPHITIPEQLTTLLLSIAGLTN
jgi:pimeloyl-ACP methyl ester carboxylesterase